LYLNAVRSYCPSARIIFNTVDLHYLRMLRQAQVENSEELRIAADAMKVRELKLISEADKTVILSQHEMDILGKENTLDSTKLRYIPLIMDVPGRTAPYSVRKDIMFVGGYNHQPNVDAVLYFLDEFFPLLREKRPDIEFFVLGSNATEAITSVSQPGVHIVGFVEDLTPYFERCRASVVPLRYGAGMKGKVLSSMSHGLPVISTSIGVEGTGLLDGRDVMVRDSPSTFVDAILEVNDGEEMWTMLSENGLEFVEQNFSKAVTTELIRDLIS
jgi:glycosyltransferase involved in cell wall biosynthesis